MGKLLGFDHFTIEGPSGKEQEIRAFYGGVLGLQERVVPEALQPSLWFACGDLQLHIGLVPALGFVPPRRGHPAFVVDDLAGLREECRKVGIAIEEATPDPACPDRCYLHDPFGNRLEVRSAHSATEAHLSRGETLPEEQGTFLLPARREEARWQLSPTH
jgi:catechol 2,3-dioxygenase-like lactoylglutathione lyase family enzyme